MPKTCCSVPGCSNRGGHEFPANENVRQAWIVAVRRLAAVNACKLWQPTSSSVVCKAHFEESDYEEYNARGFKLKIKKLKKSAVPSKKLPSTKKATPSQAAATDARNKRAEARQERHDAPEDTNDAFTSDTTTLDNGSSDNEALVCDTDIPVGCNEEATVSSPQYLSQEVQTDMVPSDVHVSTQTGKSVPLEVIRTRATDYENDPDGMQYYTGLATYEVFKDVLACLGPASAQLNYLYGTPTLTAENQLFMTLMKLRTYKPNFELSRMFKISESEVYNIFVTWIRFMSLQWRELDIWPEKEIVQFYAPSDFRHRFPTTRVIVDGTECPIKKPSAPAAQQATFSTYKNKNTVKVLVGVTPGGQVSYVSPAYAGSTSDRQIVERGNLTHRCDSGDSIMADKGFDVQDLFAPVNVTVNIPTFFRKKNRMSGKTVLKDRAISSKRVHVERVIGLGKTYKILTNSLNHTETILADDIIFVCYILVNFRKCIVPRNA